MSPNGSSFLVNFRHLLHKRLPILKWFPAYRWREDLIGDLTGGFTMGVMHVSEGMAYAPLTGLRPVNGLFTSLFPALFYMFFGTSKHVSVGGFAVICLMVGSTISRVTPRILDTMNVDNSTMDSNELDRLTYEVNVEVAAALTLGVGIAQIVMGLCQLHVLISFLSDQVIAGFTTGAAVHVMTSQLDKAIGAHIPHRDGPGRLFLVYSDLATSLFTFHFHLLTTCLSIFLIFSLFVLKNLIDPRLRSALRLTVPLPYDLTLMLLGTMFSRFFSLSDLYGVAIIGNIPTGLPTPSLPDFSLLSYLLSDSLSIALIILVIHISMGKLFAKKHLYKLDVKQEFYASGLTECLCSLFPVYLPSTSLGRSLVGEAAGAKTLFSSIFSSSMVVAVILFLGPVLEPLPTCVLASIVIVSLQGMFRQLGQIPHLWRRNPIDAIVFIVTLFGTVFVDIVAGLLIGVIFVLATVIFRTQRSGLTRNGTEPSLESGGTSETSQWLGARNKTG
ncbi:unnamed protein product, partial [Mesorhabditis belari]|uniref:SLC26A/SulP transporter domain-containing protein n=1 Tax=Mesorhabditis belari TaxID=2138241 RepID=A0AAF3F268_9BILA